MSAFVFWLGPVQAKNLAGVQWGEPTRLCVVNEWQGSRSSTAFGGIGEKISGSSDPLGELAAAGGAAGPRPDEIVMLAHFSAGFGVVEHLLRKPAVRARLSAVLAFDSYYVGGVPGAVKPGFEAWVRDVATSGVDLRDGPSRGMKTAFFSTSHTGGPTYPSASKALGPLFARLETQKADAATIAGVWKLLGSAAKERNPAAFAALPAPEAGQIVMAANAVRPAIWLDWGPKLRHVEHATKVAPIVVEGISKSFARAGGQAPPGMAPPGAGGETGARSNGGGLGVGVLVFLAKQLLSGDK